MAVVRTKRKRRMYFPCVATPSLATPERSVKRPAGRLIDALRRVSASCAAGPGTMKVPGQIGAMGKPAMAGSSESCGPKFLPAGDVWAKLSLMRQLLRSGGNRGASLPPGRYVTFKIFQPNGIQ